MTVNRKFALAFGILAVCSAVLWLGGWIVVAIFSWSKGNTATLLGKIGVVTAAAGELLTYLFGWLFNSLSQKERRTWQPGPKKYGNRKV